MAAVKPGQSGNVSRLRSVTFRRNIERGGIELVPVCALDAEEEATAGGCNSGLAVLARWARVERVRAGCTAAIVPSKR